MNEPCNPDVDTDLGFMDDVFLYFLEQGRVFAADKESLRSATRGRQPNI